MNSKAKINLNHLVENINYLKSKVSNSEIFPVVKSNAYGHGVVEVVKKLSDNLIKTVCVATNNEIIQILNEDIKIDIFHLGKIVLNNNVMRKNIIFTINSLKDIDYINEKCSKKKYQARCHIKVDTGMKRLGCEISEFRDIYELALESKYIILEGVYSHLSSADDIKSSHNKKQIKLFHQIINQVKNKNVKFHLLNSAGIFNYCKFSFDIVRTGLSIYGISPNKKIDKNLKPVMKLTAPVVLFKDIKKGDKIGYGCSYTANKNLKMAVIQCGYGDGIPLNFSNKGHVYYKNFIFPIIGRVSMDLICIDISTFNMNEEIKSVEIWGGDNKFSRLEKIAEKFETIPYIYLTSLTNRVERIYV